MKPYLLAFITIFMLACGATSALPAGREYQASVKTTHPTPQTSVVMVVIADKGLNIRADHSEGSADIGDLFPGEVVTCQIPMKVVGDSIWCHHERGWSNARWLEAK